MPTIPNSSRASISLKAVFRYFLRTPFLRNILIINLAAAALFPLFSHLYLAPAYRQMLAAIKEQNAEKAAAHLIRMLELDQGQQLSENKLKDMVEHIAELQNDLGVDKLKLFDPSGQVIFSTRPEEIGDRHTHHRFNERIAKGKTLSVIVAKGDPTLETAISPKDVVEVYVPILQGGKAVGVFEIYYDITAENTDLDRLLRHGQFSMFFIALVMVASVVLVLFKASDAMLAHGDADAALHRAHDNLEKSVEERTLDLLRANKELQLEIIERRQAEESLRLSENRFRTLIETIPHGIVEIDTRGTITFVNPAHTRLYGYAEKEILGKTLPELSAGEHERGQLHKHLEYIMRNKPHPSPWTSKDLTRDGSLIQTQVDWNYRCDSEGRVTGLIAVISEITHRKHAEKALLDNLQFMNTLIDTIPNPVFYKDAHGVYLGCNVAYSIIVGLPKDRILGRRLIDLDDIPFAAMVDYFHAQDMIQMQNPGIRTYEERLNCADGQQRDYIMFKATFRDAEGAVAGLVGIMLDISARKQIEKELKESKALFDAFIQNIPGLAYMKDVHGRYLFVNDAFARFTGGKTGTQTGMRDDQVWDADTAKLLTQNDGTILATQAAANQMETVRLPNREQRHLLTTRFPIFQDERLFALGGVSIDVTESTRAEQQRQQLERQLQQAHKMEALGTLAGGIAHDFNNILASIIGYTEIVAAETDKGSQTHHYLKRVLEAGERARALVKQILTFSRQSDIELKPVQVKVIVKEVLKLLRASLPVTIEIVQRITGDAAVMADPVQIHQVMMNLCTNAGYAMREKGGRLEVTLSEVVWDENSHDRPRELPAGRYLRLSVADSGQGIAPEHLSRIFDPFFTTKPKGEGTGMGLSVVHGIVTALKGHIFVTSAPGEGSRFDVYLPAIEQGLHIVEAETKQLPLGTERILFVDDEVFQTDMSAHLLGLLGYAVECRNRPEEALALFENNPDAFDLVITDMIMPGMTGDVLAAKLLELRPGIPIVLCTGYSENITEAKAKSLGIAAFALKPLVIEELAKLLRRVLDREAAI